MTCGEAFRGLWEQGAGDVSFAEPNGASMFTTPRLALLDWRKANRTFADALGAHLGKLGELGERDGGAAYIEADWWDEYELLRKWNLDHQVESVDDLPEGADIQVAIAAELQAAERLTCLFEEVNDAIRDVEELQAIPDAPAAKRNGLGIGGAFGLGLGLLLIVYLLGRE